MITSQLGDSLEFNDDAIVSKEIRFIGLGKKRALVFDLEIFLSFKGDISILELHG